MSFFVSFLKLTIYFNIIWSNTTVNIPVGEDLNDYKSLPEAVLLDDQGSLIDVEPVYVRNGVNRTFISTVVTSKVKDYYIDYKVVFEGYGEDVVKILFHVYDDIAPELLNVEDYQLAVFQEPPDYLADLVYKDNYDTVDYIRIDLDDSMIDYNRIGVYDLRIDLYDLSLNQATYHIQVEVLDLMKPTITQLLPLTIGVDELIDWYDYFEVSDNYDDFVCFDLFPSINRYDELGIYQIKVSASDVSGNLRTQNYEIEVMDLTVPALLLYSNPKPISVYDVNALSNLETYILEVSDNYDDLTLEDVKITHDIDINRLGTYQIFFEVSDQSLNQIKEILSVKVIDDIAPTITLTQPLIFDVFDDEPLWSLYFDIKDNYDVIAFGDVDIDEAIDMDQIGIYAVELTVKDGSKNEVTGLFYLEVRDRIPPLITQVSDIILTEFIEIDLSIYFNAEDLYEDDVLFDVIGEVLFDTIGSYDVEVEACDQSFNCSTLDTVVMVMDIEPPELTLSTNRVQVAYQAKELDMKSYITNVGDNYDELTCDDVVIDASIDYNQIGLYEAIFVLNDQSGNHISKSLYVEIMDVHPPTITGSILTVALYGQVNLFEGLVTKDDVGIFDIYASETYIDTSMPGTYVVSYVVVDTSGHQTTFQRNIVVEAVDIPFEIVDFMPVFAVILMTSIILYIIYKRYK